MTNNTRILDTSPSAIKTAAAILEAGDLVACPSETVYGLCARADDEEAVLKIFEAKNRPAINPLISHVSNLEMALRHVEMSALAQKLAEAFWPGPLTLVLPKARDLAPSVSAGLETLAIRMPAHPIMRALIEELDIPLAAPSANASGKLSPTHAAHVLRDLSGKIDAVIDGGSTDHGLESTVVLVDEKVTLLRFGSITPEDIAEVTGELPSLSTHSEKPLSPGQLLRHYAPSKRLVLNSQNGNLQLGFGTGGTLDLSPSKNLEEAARNLFAMIAELDAMKGSEIHIAPIPNSGLGLAINDRLTRAANSTK